MIDKNIDNRLKRLNGQLSKIQEDIQANKDCSEVMIQFMAVKGALSSAFEEYVKLSLDACASSDEKENKETHIHIS